MSQRQLRGTARARGEEAVDELQHRTRVKPREAGLVEASVLGNATPDIQPWSGRCGGRPANQGVRDVNPEPNKINASTPYDFNGRNLTPYGGLLPVITMLEKLGFQPLVEQTLTSKRIPRAMDLYRFVLGIVLGLYIGFPRLN